MSPHERLEAKVERITESGCWIWMGAARHAAKWPYGSMNLNGRVQGAHRVAWQIYRGAIPAGSYICHRCDIAACVNPDHLFVGDALTNMRDMIAKGRDRDGQRARTAKISKVHGEDRVFIAKSPLSFSTLARMYGISRSTVQHIKRRAKEAA